MSLIPGPIDEAIMYGPKILSSAKKIVSVAGKHKKLVAAGALIADANLNKGRILGGTLDAVGGALGKTASSVASGTANGIGNMVDSALGSEGGGILKAVGIGGGVLAAAPLVINAIGALGGMFKRRKVSQIGQMSAGDSNIAMMIQQQMMHQQVMTMMHQDMQQKQGSGKVPDTNSQDIASLKAELAALKAANNTKTSVPKPTPNSSNAKGQDMTASREFTKGPTKIEQPKSVSQKSASVTRPSQKPVSHSMVQQKEVIGPGHDKNEKSVLPTGDKHQSPSSNTNATVNARSTNPTHLLSKEKPGQPQERRKSQK